VTRIGTLPPDPRVTSFQYTVWDVDNNIVDVQSVTEYWDMVTGDTPNQGQGLGNTWFNNGQALGYDNVANGSFIDNYGSAFGYVGNQFYSATVGGTPYVISTSNSVVAPPGFAPVSVGNGIP
jgi:hypothetical protein